MFFFNQTYVVETLQHFGILEFEEEEIQVFFISLYIVDTSALSLTSDLNVQNLQARYFSLGYL